MNPQSHDCEYYLLVKHQGGGDYTFNSRGIACLVQVSVKAARLIKSVVYID